MLLYITLIPYRAIIDIHTGHTFTILFANISFQCYCLKICLIWQALSLCGIECRVAFLVR